MIEDLSKQKFNHLTVLYRGEDLVQPNGSKKTRWWCQCDCGNPQLVLVQTNHLKTGHTKSCGCIRKQLYQSYVKDLTNKRFGKLTVKKFVGMDNHRSQWECECECGNTIVMSSNNLWKTKSCGCLRSVAEYNLSVYLKDKKFLYKQQYCFKDCKNQKPLPFDFAIFNETTRKLLFLIELHGEQHYYPFTFKGENQQTKIENLRKRKETDKKKEQYCINNNIPLLVIKFNHFEDSAQIFDSFYKNIKAKKIETDIVYQSKDLKIYKHHRRQAKVHKIDIKKGIILNTYETFKEASEKNNNISTGAISDCCNHKMKTFHGWAWAYADENFDLKKTLEFATQPDNTTAKKIVQKDNEGNIIKIWNSITEASVYYNCCHYNIWACCNNKQKTAKGYKWEYY